MPTESGIPEIGWLREGTRTSKFVYRATWLPVVNWGSRLMPLRVCHYADLLCRYDADMGLKNVSLWRYYAVMPLEFLLGWWAHTGFLVDFRTVKLPPQFDNSVPC